MAEEGQQEMPGLQDMSLPQGLITETYVADPVFAGVPTRVFQGSVPIDIHRELQMELNRESQMAPPPPLVPSSSVQNPNLHYHLNLPVKSIHPLIPLIVVSAA